MKIGLALGSGAARGMSHIGVIEALERIGIKIDVVAGCSVGAIVGACYAGGKLENLKQWATSIQESDMYEYLSINFKNSGFVNANKINQLYQHLFGTASITFAELNLPFSAVATDLSTGREIHMQHGDVFEAITSSMSFPGLFPAKLKDGHWLVDGGLVNPVPVSICRAMGADIVIAVNLNSDLIQSFSTVEQKQINAPKPDGFWDKTKMHIQQTLNLISSDGTAVTAPKTFDVVSNAINIMQVHLTRGRLAGSPPDILLSPQLSHISLLDLHKSKEAINEGQDSVMRMAKEIEHQLQHLMR